MFWDFVMEDVYFHQLLFLSQAFLNSSLVNCLLMFVSFFTVTDLLKQSYG